MGVFSTFPRGKWINRGGAAICWPFSQTLGNDKTEIFFEDKYEK